MVRPRNLFEAFVQFYFYLGMAGCTALQMTHQLWLSITIQLLKSAIPKIYQVLQQDSHLITRQCLKFTNTLLGRAWCWLKSFVQWLTKNKKFYTHPLNRQNRTTRQLHRNRFEVCPRHQSSSTQQTNQRLTAI